MDEYASMRLMFSWRMAARLPGVMLAKATKPNMRAQPAWPNATFGCASVVNTIPRWKGG
jgi:hypothetical protein